MAEEIKLAAKFPVTPKRIYDAWLNDKEYTAMPGSKSTSSTKVGGKFIAVNGYISEKNLELVPNKKILQSWLSKAFSKNQVDSFMLIKLEAMKGRTKVTLIHSEIPIG